MKPYEFTLPINIVACSRAEFDSMPVEKKPDNYLFFVLEESGNIYTAYKGRYVIGHNETRVLAVLSGEKGSKGNSGDDAVITIGETTRSATQSALVIGGGTTKNRVLAFRIPPSPVGKKGDKLNDSATLDIKSVSLLNNMGERGKNAKHIVFDTVDAEMSDNDVVSVEHEQHRDEPNKNDLHFELVKGEAGNDIVLTATSASGSTTGSVVATIAKSGSNFSIAFKLVAGAAGSNGNNPTISTVSGKSSTSGSSSVTRLKIGNSYRLTFALVAGAKGATGNKGATGSKGATGDKGDKGDTGDKGADGDKGPTGDKGDKGPTGATGDKGDKGDKGDAGRNGYDTQKQTSAAIGVINLGSGVLQAEITETKDLYLAKVNIGSVSFGPSATFKYNKLKYYELSNDLPGYHEDGYMSKRKPGNGTEFTYKNAETPFHPFYHGLFCRRSVCGSNIGEIKPVLRPYQLIFNMDFSKEVSDNTYKEKISGQNFTLGSGIIQTETSGSSRTAYTYIGSGADIAITPNSIYFAERIADYGTVTMECLVRPHFTKGLQGIGGTVTLNSVISHLLEIFNSNATDYEDSPLNIPITGSPDTTYGFIQIIQIIHIGRTQSIVDLYYKTASQSTPQYMGSGLCDYNEAMLKAGNFTTVSIMRGTGSIFNRQYHYIDLRHVRIWGGAIIPSADYVHEGDTNVSGGSGNNGNGSDPGSGSGSSGSGSSGSGPWRLVDVSESTWRQGITNGNTVVTPSLPTIR